MSWLEWTDGRAALVPGRDLVVGAGERADCRIEGAELASRHFAVHAEADPAATPAATVRAAHPDHVVALNGVQVGSEPCALRQGDVILAGTARFRYLEQEAAALPAPADAWSEAWLVDERAGVGWPVAGATVGIGRDPSNAIPIRDATASRFHAQLRREAGGLAIHPSGSAGTRLNGSRLAAPTLLSEGDTIEIAGMELKVVRGPLPAGIRPAALEPVVEGEAPRRPTIMAAQALPADSQRFEWRPGKRHLLLLLIIVALLVLIFFPARA